MSLRKLAGIAAAALVAGLLFASSSAPAQGAGTAGERVLVFGRQDGDPERYNVALSLRELGVTVDVYNTLEAAGDLDAYGQIWHINPWRALDTDTEEALTTYLLEGGSLYLAGETTCCERHNDSIERIVNNSIVSGGQMTAGFSDPNLVDGPTYVAGPYTFNSRAASGISLWPNVLKNFPADNPGPVEGIGGVAARNAFASGAKYAVGGVWTEQDLLSGQGRLVVLMDVTWLSLRSKARLPIIENIHSFLAQSLDLRTIKQCWIDSWRASFGTKPPRSVSSAQLREFISDATTECGPRPTGLRLP